MMEKPAFAMTVGCGGVLLVLLLVKSVAVWAQAGGPALVEVSPVVQKTIARPVMFVGSVQPRRRSEVASEVEGIVSKVLVEEGQLVEQGAVLVELRRESIEIALRSQRGAAERYRQELLEFQNGTRPEVVEETRAAMLEAQAELERARRDQTRQSGLSLRGVAALQAREDAETAYRVAQQRLLRAKALYEIAERGPRRERIAQAEAQYQAARAEVDKLQYDLRQTHVRAPYTGFVIAKQTEEGQWLSRGATVVTLIELQKAHITVPIPERFIPYVELGATGHIQFDALPQRSWQGKVIRVIPQAAESRTFPVTVEVDNAELQIKSGFFARVTLSVGEQVDALLVPKDAVVSQGPRQIVYAVREGKAVPVPIERAAYYKSFTVITGPLQPGEQVVIRGNERLRPGQPVRVIGEGHTG